MKLPAAIDCCSRNDDTLAAPPQPLAAPPQPLAAPTQRRKVLAVNDAAGCKKAVA